MYTVRPCSCQLVSTESATGDVVAVDTSTCLFESRSNRLDPLSAWGGWTKHETHTWLVIQRPQMKDRCKRFPESHCIAQESPAAGALAEEVQLCGMVLPEGVQEIRLAGNHAWRRSGNVEGWYGGMVCGLLR